MSFAKTKLSRAVVEDNPNHTIQRMSKPIKSKKSSKFKSTKSAKPTKRKATSPPKQPSSSKASSKTSNKLRRTEKIEIHTKRIVGEGRHHVWIHMIGRGCVTVDLVMDKMDELQDILDNMGKVPALQFTFVFDFRDLQDFVDKSTIFKFGAFMKRNTTFFEDRLRKSYLLLKNWSWRMTVKALFFVFPPTKDVLYDLPEEIDHALTN